MSKKLRNWGIEKPQNVVPKALPTPAKKNTRKWCRGKTGVEHVPEVTHDVQWFTDKPCHWRLDFMSGRDRTFKWWCNHRIRCVVCRKVLESYLDGARCPHFRPGPIQPLTCVRCPHLDRDHTASHRWWNSACTQCECRSFYWEEQV